MDQQIWVLEWSKRQCAFHIQPLADAARKNANNFACNDSPNDYVIIGFGSRAQIDAAAEKAHPILDARDRARLTAREA